MDFETAASRADRHSTRLRRRIQVKFDCVLDANNRIARAVRRSDAAAMALRENKLHRRGSGGLARISIKRKIAGLYFEAVFQEPAGLCGGRIRILNIYLHFALAADVSAERLVARIRAYEYCRCGFRRGHRR